VHTCACTRVQCSHLKHLMHSGLPWSSLGVRFEVNGAGFRRTSMRGPMSTSVVERFLSANPETRTAATKQLVRIQRQTPAEARDTL
jgi:hypothetical protein